MLTAPADEAQAALEIEVSGMTKRFGDFTALENVSLKIEAGSVHALLGENGAGKSTLVKCLVGYQPPDAGEIQVDRRQREIRNPHDAHRLGVGMVYQHFTLVPGMTVAENLVMSRDDLRAIVNWRRERAALERFMQTVPFRIPLDAVAANLAAGEKQKTEILKQLYRRRRFVILDEPTSVLTPQEADDVLGMLRDLAQRKVLTVLLITHKFREVIKYCDAVTVLRRGRLAGRGKVEGLSVDGLAEMMVGTRETLPQTRPNARGIDIGAVRLSIRGLCVADDAGLQAVKGIDLDVRAGEIVGVAGVSGNGQRELVQALVGQRAPTAGRMQVNGEPYRAVRRDMLRHGVYSLPEEPLKSACVPHFSVAENMALRNFDQAPIAYGPWLRPAAIDDQARDLIAQYKVKTRGPRAPIRTLSGGNVQRAVLARELSGRASVLIAANPVFGLDFSAVAEIHARLRAVRAGGGAVLLVSEDLDELLELADRIVVIAEGRLAYETPAGGADIIAIGRAMAGHADALQGAA